LNEIIIINETILINKSDIYIKSQKNYLNELKNNMPFKKTINNKINHLGNIIIIYFT